MNTKKKAAQHGEAATNATKTNAQLTTKQARVLQLFVQLGERGCNCFEAANFYHDYVLHSTVSVIQKRYGLYFERKSERVPNSFGGQTRVVRYWLDPANIEVAKHILGGAG